MKNLYLIILLSISLVAAAGCCGPRQLPVRTDIKDSVAVRYKDSTVVRYVDVEVPVPVECSRAVVRDSSHLETSVAISEASIDSLGRLHHSMQNKPVKMLAQVPVKDEYHELEVAATTTTTKIVEVPVEKPLTWWQSFRLNAFWWLLGVLAIGVLIKILKYRLSL